jgi:hypothetical protein
MEDFVYRQLLTFLLVWPLLLPSGVCVCDWFAADCHACAVCEADFDHTDDKATLLPGHTCHHHAPAQNGSDHMPGCPAKSGHAWRTEAPDRSTLVTGICAFIEFVADLYSPSFAVEAVRPVGPARAIFLTHLNLRI